MRKLVSNNYYSDNELVGKFVMVISNSSVYYKKIGRVIGFSKNKKMIYVYFDEIKLKALFDRNSLELMN